VPDELSNGHPHVEHWLEGADTQHPLLEQSVQDFVFSALEGILAPIDDAAPLRIGQKRAAFAALRTDHAFMEQRAELLVASMLARAGVAFDFAKDHPDLLIGNAAAGIEVGTRALDSPEALRDLLEQRLTGRPGLSISLDFTGRPLKLPRLRIEEIAEQIAELNPPSAGMSLAFPDLNLIARLEPISELEPAVATVTFDGGLGVNLASHMAEAEREISDKLEEKRRQASKVPTLLLLDLARVGWAWLRTQAWVPLLRAKLEGEPFVGLGLMFSSLDRDTPMQLHIHWNRGTSAELDEALDLVAKTFNLTTVT
jgi:hypothetical protein